MGKILSRAFLSLIYVGAGVLHLVRPDSFLKIVPPYLPAPGLLVLISGLAEIALGVGLWVPGMEKISAWGIVALLVSVFPANIYMYQLGGASFGWPDWLVLARLPLQAVLIAWAYWHTR